MNREQWEAVKRLLDEASELSPEEQTDFFKRRADTDTTVQALVVQFLNGEPESILSLEQSLSGFVRAQIFEEYGLNEYEILDILGHGGMGEVLLATRRDDPSGRKVALKLISSRINPENPLWKRFQREQEVQTRLEHPNVARVYRWGTTIEGRPFVEMEYIEGQPLDQYCQERNLPIKVRLNLFRQLCAAVHYAHQNLVVHRDLKPGNILVTAHGEVKLLDFGIAKLLDHDDVSAPAETTAPLMTLAYASPEQIRGEAIATLSDVYSLGIVLYELLSDIRPYSLEGLSPKMVEERVCEVEPTPPSEVSVYIDGRHLAGDLDRIVMMALRKEPNRRYNSVQQLSNDIRCYLDKRPVLAHEPTFLYRTGKFLRRNRLPVALTSIAVILVIFFMWHQEQQRRKLAEERDRTQVVSDFLVEIFKSSDPYQQDVQDRTARNLLDTAQERIHEGLERNPEVQIELQLAMSHIYMNIGLYDSARQLIEETLKIQQELEQKQPQQLAASLNLYGLILQHQGDFDASRKRYETALQIQREYGEDKARASTLSNLGRLAQMQSRYDEADRLYRESIGLAEKIWGANHVETANVRSNLGTLLVGLGRLDEAESVFSEILRIRRVTYGDQHPNVADTLNSRGEVLRRRGDYKEAQESFEAALETWTNTVGPEHPYVAAALHNLGLVKKETGLYDEAEILYRRALDIRRQAYHSDHPSVALSLNLLGAVYDDRGEFEKAEHHYREALSIQESTLGSKNVATVITRNNLALILQHQKRYERAEELLQGVLSSLKEMLGAPHPNVALAYDNLGWLLYVKEEYVRAEEYVRQGLAMAEKTRPANHSQIAYSATKLSSILLRQGQCEEAVPLAERAVEILEPVLGIKHWRTATAQGVLGGCLVQEGRFEEAESLLLLSQNVVLEMKGPKPQTRENALRLLIDLYDGWGRPEDTLRYRTQLENEQ